MDNKIIIQGDTIRCDDVGIMHFYERNFPDVYAELEITLMDRTTKKKFIGKTGKEIEEIKRVAELLLKPRNKKNGE